MIKVHTTGRYLVKGDEKKVKEDRLYTPEELQGWYSKAGTILLQDLETGTKTVIAPGQPMSFDIPDAEPELTKADLKALMPDRKFPKNISKAKLLEAYHGGS